MSNIFGISFVLKLHAYLKTKSHQYYMVKFCPSQLRCEEKNINFFYLTLYPPVYFLIRDGRNGADILKITAYCHSLCLLCSFFIPSQPIYLINYLFSDLLNHLFTSILTHSSVFSVHKPMALLCISLLI